METQDFVDLELNVSTSTRRNKVTLVASPGAKSKKQELKVQPSSPAQPINELRKDKSPPRPTTKYQGFYHYKLILDLPSSLLRNYDSIRKKQVGLEELCQDFTRAVDEILFQQTELSFSPSEQLKKKQLVIPVVLIEGSEVPVETVRNMFLFIVERRRKTETGHRNSPNSLQIVNASSRDKLIREFRSMAQVLLKPSTAGQRTVARSPKMTKGSQKKHGMLLETIDRILTERHHYRVVSRGPSESEISLLEEKRGDDINTKLFKRMKYEKGEGLMDYLSINSIFQQADTIQILRKALYLQNINFSEKCVRPAFEYQTRSVSVESMGDPDDVETQEIDLERYIFRLGRQVSQQERQTLEQLVEWYNDLRAILGKS